MEERIRRWIERRYGVTLKDVEIRRSPTLSSWTDLKSGKIVVNVSGVEGPLGRRWAALAHELAHAAQIKRILLAGGDVRGALRRPTIYEADALEAERGASKVWPHISRALAWIIPPLGYALWRYRKTLRAMEEMGVGVHPEKFYRLERYAWKEHRLLRLAVRMSNAFMRFSGWLAERGKK